MGSVLPRNLRIGDNVPPITFEKVGTFPKIVGHNIKGYFWEMLILTDKLPISEGLDGV